MEKHSSWFSNFRCPACGKFAGWKRLFRGKSDPWIWNCEGCGARVGLDFGRGCLVFTLIAPIYAYYFLFFGTGSRWRFGFTVLLFIILVLLMRKVVLKKPHDED